MAMGVQGTASPIGMAPSSTGMDAGAGALPQLTGGAAGDPTAAAGMPAAGAQDPNAAATGGATPPAGFDITKISSQGRWLGPLLTIGGGFAALRGFGAIGRAAPAANAVAGAAAVASKGSGLLKWGGIAAALGGIGLTAMGFKAKGIETGTKATELEAVAAIQYMQDTSNSQMAQVKAEAEAQIAALQQQNAAATAGAGATAPGAGAGAADLGVGPGLDTTVVPGGGQQAPVGTGTGAAAPAHASTTPASPTTPAAPTTPAGPWTVQSLVGQTVDLQVGASAGGTPIAEAGTYRIEQLAGDPNGYASIDEANAATRQSMSTELMGSKFLRWMVVEHGGRFYGVVAKQAAPGTQPAPLSPQVGNVVAWSAMNHVSENNVNGWQAYSWTAATGGQSMAVPYGTSNVFGSVATGGGPVGGAPTGTAPVTGGGAAGAFSPSSEVGRTFAINEAKTAEGDAVRGGTLQLQQLAASSASGFGSAEEAAAAARAERAAAGGGDKWARWVSVQGTDNRFYVYKGSIVARPTVEAQAAPVHVFGSGVAEYFDGASSSWKAVRDAA